MPTRTARATETTTDPAELVRRGYAALNGGDDQALLATLHPEIEYQTLGLFPGLEPVYRGHDGVLRLLRTMRDAFDVLELSAERMVLTDDGVVVLVHWHARGRDSGAEATLVSIDEFEVRDELLHRRLAHEPTPENAELFGLRPPLDWVRRAYEMWNQDDQSEIQRGMDPELIFRPSGVFPGLTGEYHGHDGFRAWWDAMKEPFEWFRVDVVRLVEREPQVAAHVVFRALGRESGARVELNFVNVFTFRKGLVVELEGMPATPEALQEHGLA